MKIPDILSALANHTEQCILAYDPGSVRFLYMNPAFRNFLRKMEVSDADPSALYALVHPEDKSFVAKKYAAVMAGAIELDLEFRMQVRDGQDVWLSVSPYLETIHGNQVLIIEATDVSEVKRHTAVLNKFASKKNAILHIISHELAGPLGMINNLSSMLDEKIKDSDDDTLFDLVRMIREINGQNITLLNEFLHHEFLETAEVELVMRRVNLVSRSADIIAEYKNSETLGRKVFTFYSPVPELFVNLDDPKFMQVVNNLIWNAIKFTPDGGIIKLTLEEEDTAVVMKLEDNGIGIPEKFHPVLFDKFTPARRPGLKGEPTIGLGMSVIKTLVEWHGGEIWFHSEENVGSSFYIRLPKA